MLWQGHCSASPARYTRTAYPFACGGGGGFVRTYTRCSLVLARVTCAGWFGRNVCFVVAAHLFHCLSRVVRESSCEPCSCRCPHHQLGLAPGCVQVLHDDGVAYRAALLFCLTPAGVFMSALYSERCAALASWARYALAMRDRFRWLPPACSPCSPSQECWRCVANSITLGKGRAFWWSTGHPQARLLLRGLRSYTVVLGPRRVASRLQRQLAPTASSCVVRRRWQGGERSVG